MLMVMVGIDDKMSEVVVPTVVVATCRLRWRESVASRDVVGDAMARVSSSRIAIIFGDGIARQFAPRRVAFVFVVVKKDALMSQCGEFEVIHLGGDF
jgi:hypothetical protein